jgi:uncharacterized MAPEG superfamily protein
MNLSDLPVFRFAGLSGELSMLALATLLGLVQLIVAGRAGNSQRGVKWNLGPRDEPAPPVSKLAGRLERARANFMETFAFFAAAVLVAALAQRSNWATLYGSEIYVAARVLYWPLYAAGVFGLRTLVWLIALIGILLVLVGLLWPGL